MTDMHFWVCDVCGSQSKPASDLYSWGWSYFGFLSRDKNGINKKHLCPRCSAKIKKEISILRKGDPKDMSMKELDGIVKGLSDVAEGRVRPMAEIDSEVNRRHP